MKRLKLSIAILFLITFCLNAQAEWIALSPSAENLNLHYRVDAGKGAAFGIDVAEGDTSSWRSFEIEVPDVWPEEYSSSLGVKINFSEHISETVVADSTFKAAIFVDSRKSAGISLKISGRTDRALLEAGGREAVFSKSVAFCDTLPIYIRFFSNENASDVRQTCLYDSKPEIRKASFSDIDSLKDYLKQSEDPYEGLWQFYDRTSSPLRAASDGEYILATVRNGQDYDVIYVDDKSRIPSPWKPLTVKATLEGCDVPGVFDADWIDRSANRVNSRVAAVFDGDFLTFSFPYWKISLRYNRIDLNRHYAEP